METTRFSVFPARLAEACKARNTTLFKIANAVGLAPRRAINLQYSGARGLDVESLTKIADSLEVSIDWLLGRTNVMELPKLNAA